MSTDTRLTELPRDDEAVFYSRFNTHVLVRKPQVTAYTETGVRRELEGGKRYQFENGVLKVRPGRDKWAGDRESTLAEGKDPDVERDVVQWLMDHEDFNRTFWREGFEPGRLYPREEDVLAEMSTAAAALDVDALQAMLDAERSSHNRPLLTGALSGAVRAASAAREQVLAQETAPVTGDGENALEWSEGDNKDRLQEVADAAGVKVRGTGADGNVTKDDLVRSLKRETNKAREKRA